MKEDWKERLETLLQRMTIDTEGEVKSDSYEAEFCEYIKRYAQLKLDIMPYVRRYNKLCELAFKRKEEE